MKETKDMKRTLLLIVLTFALGGVAVGQSLTASITPKAATVTCTSPPKVYDGTTAAPGTACVLGGILPGDVVGVASFTASFATKQAGTAKTVSITSIVTNGVDAGNYTVPTSATATADITKRLLTVSNLTVSNKTYDATTVATVNAGASVLTGLVAGDACALDPSSLTASFADKNVGQNKPVTLNGTAGITGVDCVNYTLSVPPPPPPPPPSGLLGASNLVYQGAFRIPTNFASDAVSFNYGLAAMTYDASRGGLIAAGFPKNGGGLVGEVSIPAIRTGAFSTLATATLLQPMTDILRGKRLTVDGDTSNGVEIAGILPVGSDLIVSAFTYYDGAGTQSLSHFRVSSDFAQTSVVGPVAIGNTLGNVCGSTAPYGPCKAGFVFGYMTPIPTAWQSALGGRYLTGACCRAIIGRTSLGPSLTVFDPTQIGTISPVPGVTVLGYPITHPTIGAYAPPGYLYNGAADVEGVVFPTGSSSVLFFGAIPTSASNFCYGAGTTDPTLNRQPNPAAGPNEVWCYDPSNLSKGTHGYPYQSFVWAYDANDLVKVKQGLKLPWEIVPYATWSFTTPFQTEIGYNGSKRVTGAAYDPATQHLFLGMTGQDGCCTPLVHVWTIVP